MDYQFLQGTEMITTLSLYVKNETTDMLNTTEVSYHFVIFLSSLTFLPCSFTLKA